MAEHCHLNRLQLRLSLLSPSSFDGLAKRRPSEDQLDHSSSGIPWIFWISENRRQFPSSIGQMISLPHHRPLRSAIQRRPLLRAEQEIERQEPPQDGLNCRHRCRHCRHHRLHLQVEPQHVQVERQQVVRQLLNWQVGLLLLQVELLHVELLLWQV